MKHWFRLFLAMLAKIPFSTELEERCFGGLEKVHKNMKIGEI